MELRELGKTGLNVSRLCFGTLTLSKSQSDKTPQEGGELLAYALERGVNFFDTAQLYGTYNHIKECIKRSGKLPIISTKSYAYDRKGARESLDSARREMGIDIIDLFMIHEQESVLTMLGHSEALKYYLEMKEKGIIKAVGISTHAVEPLLAILKVKDKGAVNKNKFIKFPRINEFDAGLYSQIDVVHPIINFRGIGILDGTKEEMNYAAEKLSLLETGIFAMKILGGGNLLNNIDEALDYALSLDFVDSYAMGMQSYQEIDANVNLFLTGKFKSEDVDYAKSKKRKLLIEDWCTGCGNCVRKCKSGAIEIIDSKAVVNSEKCLLCSYCAAVCNDFAIKVV